MSYTPTPQKKSQKTLDFQVKYKTQKCRYLMERGYCPYAQTCTFAHSDEEVRQKRHISNNYRTRTCINFANKGCCSYGNRCLYLHSIPEKQIEKDGQQTRSNSEESATSKSSKSSKNAINHNSIHIPSNKRIQLIHDLGFDIKLRSESRLLQLLTKQVYFDHEPLFFEELGEVASPIGFSIEKKEKKHSI